ncbi:MAG: hypothetical protein IJ192_07960 [Clostridia bacterium]|nr:hypothetical protein [Clostridia bacterium]
MYPIPTHLKNHFIVDEEKTEEHWLVGKAKCNCGCEKLKMRYFGCEETDKEGKKYLTIEHYEDGFASVVRGECADCGENFDLYDLSKYGYAGFVNQEGRAVPDDILKYYQCECGGDSFEAVIMIELEDKEQFIEEIVEYEPEKFKADDYVDSYDWITISIRCCGCKKTTERWYDLELS